MAKLKASWRRWPVCFCGACIKCGCDRPWLHHERPNDCVSRRLWTISVWPGWRFVIRKGYEYPAGRPRHKIASTIRSIPRKGNEIAHRTTTMLDAFREGFKAGRNGDIH